MTKYLKVMFGTISGADSNQWNPNSLQAKEMGGFNFSTEDKILRWLVRGDAIYVEIPEDAEVNC